jgi:hypothetical protein
LDAKDTLFVVAAPAVGAVAAQSDVQLAQTRGDSVLDSLYSPTSTLLTKRKELLHRGIEIQQSGDFKVIGGGIRDVSFDSMTITGVTATVHLTYTNDAEYAARQPDGSVLHANPSNQMIEDVGLIKTDQGWRITSDVSNFAPGSEP